MGQGSGPSRRAFDGVSIEEGTELSRGDVILRGALAAGALYGLGAITPYVRNAVAATKGSDIDILNYLLPFEYLQVAIYNRGKSEIDVRGDKLPLNGERKKLMATLLDEEGKHVAALRKMIEERGGTPAKKGNYTLSFRDFYSLLARSVTLERVAIGAYNGAIPSLESAEVRELAFSIVQVEGRHVAQALFLEREDPVPEPFDGGESEVNSINSVIQFTGIYPDYEKGGWEEG